MNYLEHLINNKKIFFNFMKEDYPLFKYSNIFFRDLQYAISTYFKMKEKPVSYAEASLIATDFINYMVNKGELLQIDNKSWKVNFEILNEKASSTFEGVKHE